MGQLNEAKDAHEKAIQMRLTAGSDRIGNSYSNMASLLLRLGKAEEAEEMLKRCPSLKDFTDETFLNTGNPRFSGDMVLVSRIRYQQGRLSEAVRLSSKALVFRQDLLGNRLKTCDSLYDVAFFTHKQGNDTAPMYVICLLYTQGEASNALNVANLLFYFNKRTFATDGRNRWFFPRRKGPTRAGTLQAQYSL